MVLVNKEKNFVSAVVYLYNDQDNVKEFLGLINNTLKNNFEKYEIVCVNDCSTDNTVAVVDEFCTNNSVKSLSLINTSYFQGVESAMVAGLDLAIGDFVFEFDSCISDYDEQLIMDTYKKSLEGNDIVFACPNSGAKLSSKVFYGLFNSFSSMEYKIKTQRFSVISRRGINRVKSMGVKTVYRKAVYASCGLNVSEIAYKPKEETKGTDHQKTIKKDLALNSLILFTDIGYKISLGFSVLMSLVLLFVGIYTVAIYLSSTPVTGWTTTMLVLSGGFFGVFLVFAFVMKYLSLILNLVFTNKQYVVESVRKITK